MTPIAQLIEQAFADRSLLQQPEVAAAIRAVLEDLNTGRLRVAEPAESGWQVNEWVKKAVLLYFLIQPMRTTRSRPAGIL